VRGALGALEIEVEAGELGALSIGQITVACALGYLDFRYAAEQWRAKHRRLAAWFDEFSTRKSIELTKPKDPA
jgi:glutathione S-transferase